MALEKIKPFIVDGTLDFVFGNVTVTGNITSNNANLGNLATANFFSGTLTTNSQPNITSVGTLENLSVTSNISTGNIKTNNLLYANGSPWQIGTTTTVSGSNTQVQFNDSSSFGASANFTFDKSTNTLTVTNLVTNGSGITNITGTSVTGQVPNALVSSTVYTNSQPNITSVGTLTSLTVSGEITGSSANLSNTVTANYFVGSGNNLSNIQGSNITGAVAYATTANSVAGSNVNGAVTYAATANAVAGANVFGQVSNSLVSGTIYTNAQPNITSVGTLSNLNVTGNVTGNAFYGNATGLTSIPAANVTGTVANATYAVTAGSADSVAVANVVGIGNISTINLNGDGSQVLAGNGAWIAQSGGGTTANITVDSFTGNGVQTIFMLSTTPSDVNQTTINYNGATVSRADYTLTNANITFSSAPANGSFIEITTINLLTGGGSGGSGGGSAAAAIGYSLVFGG